MLTCIHFSFSYILTYCDPSWDSSKPSEPRHPEDRSIGCRKSSAALSHPAVALGLAGSFEASLKGSFWEPSRDLQGLRVLGSGVQVLGP